MHKSKRHTLLYLRQCVKLLFAVGYIGMCTHTYAQESGGTIAQSEKRIAKEKKKRAKQLAKANKHGKKRFVGMQSKETQKRMKQQQKELKKRAKRQAREQKRKRRRR